MDKKTLKLLILEDNPLDAELEVKELESKGFILDWKRVDTEKDFKKALKENPDLIIADYKLPSFDGMSAIKIQQKTTPDIPLIIISGTIGEEIAIECLKAGATDYVLKGKLSRLIPVVKRALKETEERRERKKAEKALRKSEEQFRLIAENTSDNIAITTFDLKATYLYLSPSLKSMVGYDLEDLLGKSFFDFIHPEDKKILLPLLKKYINNKIKKLISGKESIVSETIEYRFINKDREWRNFQSTVNIAGKQLISVTRDVTERKQAEEELIQSEKSYRDLFNNASDAIYIQDREGRFLDVNQGAVDMYGYSKEFFIGKTPEFLSAPGKNDMKKIIGFVEDAFNGKTRQYDFWGIRKNGEVFPKIVRSQQGFYLGRKVIITYALDITEQKQAEEIQKALYNISNALNTTDKMRDFYNKIREYLGNMIDTTNFYVALYDEKTDMISLPFNVDEKDDFETFPAGKTITKYVIKTGKSLFATKDVVKKLIKKGLIETVGTPSEIWLGVPLKIENKVIGVIAVQSYDDPNLYTEKDIEILTFISEEIALAINRKQAEETLNKELRKRQILQDVALSLLETDLKKSIKTSLKAIRIGLDLPKVMLRIRVDPNNDWQIVDCRESLLGIGSVLPTNIRGVDAILAYEKKEISVVNDIRKKYWYEKHKDIWEKTKTLAYLSIPCIDYSGDVKGILYLHDDRVRIWSDDDKNIGKAVAAELASIIERKQAEEELKINRERLKTANSILRHDIANDVIVIKSALDIYRDEQDETMLDEIEKRVEKSLNTIKKQRDQEQFIDSHTALDEYDMEKVAHDIIKNFPNIKFNVTGTGRAYADNAIYSVFENIISNAIKHGKTTKMDIDISSDEDHCEIRFSDYGIGIPDEMKYKIFDEGFQYGETGHTGIGLYIVQQTVDDYGGIVFVEDNKPSGAVFVIRLKKIIER